MGSNTYEGSRRPVVADLATGTAYKVLNILPLGDSITHGVIHPGDTESGGYRTALQARLAEFGVRADFTGSLSNGPSSIDRHHQGHRGWTIDQLNGQQASIAAAAQPDVILLMAGTNDSATDSASRMLQDMRSFLQNLAGSASGALILVASLPPVRVGTHSQERANRVEAFNAGLPALLAELTGQGIQVRHVPMPLTLEDISPLSVDSGLHPTTQGYDRMAGIWTAALETHFGLDATGLGPERDRFTGIENLTGSAMNDRLTGNGAANTLDGGRGADMLAGGAGDDTYFVDHAGDRTVELAGEGRDTVHTYVNWTMADHTEVLFLRSAASLAATGNALANAITGNSGANQIDGAAGNDTLDGRGGNDTIIGGRGDDTLMGGAGNDTFLFRAGDGRDVITDLAAGERVEIEGYAGWQDLQAQGADTLVVLSAGDSLLLQNVSVAEAQARLTFGGALPPAEPEPPEEEEMRGTEGADTLTGGSGADLMSGLSGNDLLDGRGGADTMTGGAGDDTYFVDHAGDRTVELAGEGRDTVHTYVNWTMADHTEVLFLRSAASLAATGNALANAITGNSGANQIDGAAGNDTLDGRGGNDTIIGGRGDDTLMGGAGNDTFLFRAGDGRDVITDLAAGERVEIEGYAGWQDLQAQGADALVVLSAGDSLLLQNVSVTEAQARLVFGDLLV
ncbi:GDSL-type esterase/lipase family protein (plasmid) [Cereibacter azotoformans]|uniref:GDSL-type esterase/lipase family protein n=1 Tax=Cereibacter azotoformans TaxID=43057 RepID=UPI001EEAFEF1|nr:GDSL-type esterase/lipase family protein [Cereibacter azotoformans]ULB12363.1 GDSL-type esterase/lipase family protein [Cereibacter azotoformans]